MVSLRKKFSVCFFIFALVLVCLLMPAELKASIPCCKNGKLSSCPDLPNGQQYDISKCTSVNPVNPVVPVNPGEKYGEAVLVNDCTLGQTQYKPSGSCGTSSRKCCSNGSWSAWDGECDGASSCTANQCWNGRKCEDKGAVQSTCKALIPHTISGDLARTAKCISGSVWQYGDWDGVCECAEGYVPDEDNSLTCHEAHYYWKILSTEKVGETSLESTDKSYCESGSNGSLTPQWRELYGADTSELLGSDCKKWLDKYARDIDERFSIWQNGKCYIYSLKCVKS